MAPCLSQVAFTSGSSITLLTELLRKVTTSLGVPFGAIRPIQMVDSYPGTDSPTVGRSGVSGLRSLPVVASARTLLALANSDITVMASNIICTLPDSTLLRISPEALCGTCTVSYTHLRAHETRHDLVCRLL